MFTLPYLEFSFASAFRSTFLLIHYFIVHMLLWTVTMQETLVWFLHRKIPWRRDRLPTPVFLAFPCGSTGKESTCNAGDMDSIPGLGRCHGVWKGYPLWYSGLENSMDCISPWGHTESDTTEWLSFHKTWKGVLVQDNIVSALNHYRSLGIF